MKIRRKARSIEMVTGSLWKNILFFSIPLMCSQLLEVMFNLSDVAVVGHFADYKALGAVGSTTLLVTLFAGFLIGMGSGVNVRTRPRAWCRKSPEYRRDHTDSTYSLCIDRDCWSAQSVSSFPVECSDFYNTPKMI